MRATPTVQPYRLIVVTRGARGGQRIYDLAAEVVRIGRDEQVEVRLPHASVSKVHVRLERRDGAVWAIDTGSTNGTAIGQERLAAGVPRELGDGEVLTIGGKFDVAYYAESPDGAMLTGPKLTAELAQQLVADLLMTGAGGGRAAAGAAPELVGEGGAAGGQRFRLQAPDSRQVFGRGEDCDVILIDRDLSREHFEVRRTWNGATVCDLGSKNGTHLNGQRLPPREAVALEDGAKLRAAACTFTFVDPTARYLAQLEALVADAPEEPAPEADDQVPVDAEAAEGAAAAASALDESWSGRVVAEPAPADPQEPDAPSERSSGGAPIALIVLGALVIAAVAGLVLLLAS